MPVALQDYSYLFIHSFFSCLDIYFALAVHWNRVSTIRQCSNCAGITAYHQIHTITQTLTSLKISIELLNWIFCLIQSRAKQHHVRQTVLLALRGKSPGQLKNWFDLSKIAFMETACFECNADDERQKFAFKTFERLSRVMIKHETNMSKSSSAYPRPSVLICRL